MKFRINSIILRHDAEFVDADARLDGDIAYIQIEDGIILSVEQAVEHMKRGLAFYLTYFLPDDTSCDIDVGFGLETLRYTLTTDEGIKKYNEWAATMPTSAALPFGQYKVTDTDLLLSLPRLANTTETRAHLFGRVK